MPTHSNSHQACSSNVTTKSEHNPKYGTKVCATEISFHNPSEAITSTKYDVDETLDIKDEIIKDVETKEVTGQRFNKKYESEVRSVDLGEDSLAGNMKQLSQKQQEMKNLETEIKYKCKKCARSYKDNRHLTFHRKYECDVTRQFTCNFCGKLFKRKAHMNAHVDMVHLKSNSKRTKAKYTCNYCTRSYKYLRSLNRHKREVHAGIKRQFICDYCGHIASQKNNLGTHINSRHLK
ncbi:zinc finger protein 681-like [Belonocnema kinseyi]|uniref:zinc finger protein 681-like n=1 Tax=Belonocnema kinseyi TaxID=2817044 RepID=UPI00143D3ED3|nr:zinc finger protein 681-like [Belonocnema kinseyi]